MKKNLITIILLLESVLSNAQSYDNGFEAYDTNGTIGECLFPMDNKWQEVIECDRNQTDILRAIKRYMYDLTKSQDFNAEVNHEEQYEDIYSCDIQLFIGKPRFSELKFNVKIEVKDSKYRITLYDFYTERMTIRGDGESDGQSNILHWQRVNSLTKEKVAVMQKKLTAKRTDEIAEYDNMIAREQYFYQEEWNTTCGFMEGLKHCTEGPDF